MREREGEGPSPRARGAVAEATIAALGPFAHLAAIVALASLPSRVAVARHEARLGSAFAPHLLFGVLVDLRDWLPLAALLATTIALSSRLARRDVSARGACVAAAVLLWCIMPVGLVAATEFRIERGLYPTPLDVRPGLDDAGFVLSGLTLLSMPRFQLPLVASTLAAVALSATYLVRGRGSQAARGAWVGVVAMVIVTSAAAFGLHRASPLISSLASWRLVESPLAFLLRGARYENVQLGAMAAFERATPRPDLHAAGAAALGLPVDALDRLDRQPGAGGCDPHPLASPLFAEPAPDDALGRDLDHLSRALFADRTGTLRVWQIVLESMRADDIHGVNPAAPAAIAPALTRLYERSREPATTVVASPLAFSAAHRTSQGFSAVLCGLGTMPGGLSFSRDFGLLPARCLPDVLRDAGFAATFFHGANPGFDNMDAFLRYHGVTRMKTQRDFVVSQRFDGWGVPDGVVFAQSFDDVEARVEGPSQWNFVLSLTNHFPYVLPADAPADRRRAVDEVAVTGHDVAPEDVARLQTFAYADEMLGRLVASIERSPRAASSFAVIVADHSDPAHLLWAAGRREAAPLAYARVPLVLVFPTAFVDASADPTAARVAISRLNQRLAVEPISQNDLPRLLLRLLGAWHDLKNLAVPWRWHTLGGQRLSPSFRFESAARAAVFGVRADMRLFAADRAGTMLGLDTPVFHHGGDDHAARPDGLEPPGALVSAWLRGHARRCRSSPIRATP